MFKIFLPKKFRYERCAKQELHSKFVDHEQPSHSRERGLGTTELSITNQSYADCNVLKRNRKVDVKNGSATVSEVRAVISTDPEVSENLRCHKIWLGNESNGTHVGSSGSAPYIDGNDESLFEHVQKRGRYIREHFATLLHALRINELLAVKAIRMFMDYTADLFDQESRDAN